MENSPYGIERISIGEVAKIHNISTRTLRLYHEKNLFIPSYIDEESGYRYYTSSQFPRLQTIIEMREIGLSLKEIEIILNNRDITILEALLSENIDEIEKQISNLKASRNLLINWLNSCRHIKTPPVLDKIFIEYLPERKAYIFDIPEYDFLETYPEVSPWEKALKEINLNLRSKDLSLKYLDQVGCMIPRDALEKGKLLCNGAFILIDENGNGLNSDLRVSQIPHGTYVCMYRKYTAMDNQSESIGLIKLLEYINKNEFNIVGSYYGEIVARTSIFDYSDHSILVKLQIPIKIKKV